MSDSAKEIVAAPAVTLCSLTYNTRGHARAYVKNLKTVLEEMGHDVSLLTPDKGRGLSHKFADVAMGIAEAFSKRKSFKLFRTPLRSIASFVLVGYGWWNLRSDSRVLILDYEYFSIIPFLMLSHRFRRQSTLLLHSGTTGEGLARLYKGLFFSCARRYVRKGGVVIVNGHSIREAFVRRGFDQSRVVVVQYPADRIADSYSGTKAAARRELGIPKNSIVLSMIGMIRPDKNYEATITALSEMLSQDDRLHLLVAGSPLGYRESEIRAWGSGTDANRITWVIKYLETVELARVFRASDYIVVNYDTSNVSQSGPLSTAREFGVPAIVKDGAEFGSYVRRYGVGVSMISEAELPRMVRYCIDKIDTGKYGEWSERIRAIDKELSWPRAAERIMAAVERQGIG